MDFSQPHLSYFLGFSFADGTLYSPTGQNKGSFKIELSNKDRHILEYFQSVIPYYSSIGDRTRETNFGLIESSILRIYDIKFRSILEGTGLPVGHKSDRINVPTVIFSKADFFRGFVDGDGSVGVTAKGLPFVSIVTKSKNFATSYCDYIFEMIGIKRTGNPNKRDGVANIMLTNELAQQFINILYYPNCICLERKKNRVKQALQWVRPSTMRRPYKTQSWTPEHDKIISENPLDVAMKLLDRSDQSIKMRLLRLRYGLNYGNT